MIKRRFKRMGVLVLSISLMTMGLAACSGPEGGSDTKSGEVDRITVSAAASLTEALSEIGGEFEQETGNKVNFNFGSSGALQKQIEEGAPVDVFLSAGQPQMDALEEANLLKDGTRSDILENSLVLIASSDYADEISGLEDLLGIDEKIAIAETETSPAGQYSKESLENLGLWTELQGKFVYGKDVKTVVSYVEKGEASAGFVFSSDVTDLKSAKLIERISPSTHSEIVYPIAIIESSSKAEVAQEFIDYLGESRSSEIFKDNGFKTR